MLCPRYTRLVLRYEKDKDLITDSNKRYNCVNLVTLCSVFLV
jgi:hypothetical protein